MYHYKLEQSKGLYLLFSKLFVAKTDPDFVFEIICKEKSCLYFIVIWRWHIYLITSPQGEILRLVFVCSAIKAHYQKFGVRMLGTGLWQPHFCDWAIFFVIWEIFLFFWEILLCYLRNSNVKDHQAGQLTWFQIVAQIQMKTL